MIHCVNGTGPPAMEPKSRSTSSRNCLTMPGEDTGLGALASPMAGYLGKVQERAASLEHCPWCTSKGLTHALRSYRINLQDSITLCTNPQCLFPMVSRPLEDILASLQPTVSSKRKTDTLPEEEEEESTEPLKKRLRSTTDVGHGLACVSDSPVSPAAPQLNGYQSNDLALETTGRSSPLIEDCVPEQDSNSPPCVDSEDIGLSPEVDEGAVPSPQSCCERSMSESDSKLRETPPEAVDSSSSPRSAKKEVEIPREEKPSLPESESETVSVAEAEDSVAVPQQLFWSNTANLCWLNTLLMALVNCKSLRRRDAQLEPQPSAVGKLMKDYDHICSEIRAHQHTDTDGVIRAPHHTLQKANDDLEHLRKRVIQLLKPKLKFKMGQKGSPVFAMPILLAMDSWAECHFQSAFTWEFKCNKCDYATNERVTKTLPSVTNLVPDWRPLNAVHTAPCNKCRSRKQKRTMKLERLPSVFALHFVKGLPENDVGLYAFDFNKESYSVTTVIQYKQQLRHFVTWTRNADGLWLEYDDLKHPVCEAHQELAVPPCEMHVVFWEAGRMNEPRVCSPSSTFTESLSRSQTLPSSTKTPAEELLTCSPDQSLLRAPNDSDIIHALDVTDTTLTADASIGTTTLLDTFEGLTHSDIITLTLVECSPDTETQRSNANDEQSAPSRSEAADATPDSSSAAVESKARPSHDDELSTVSLSSDSESPDDGSSDPTFVPSAKKRAAACRQRAKRKSAREAAAMAAIVESPTVKEDATRGETSLVSTTDGAPLSSSLPDLNGRWSYLINKRQPPKPSPTKTPSVTQVKSFASPLFSTPKPPKNPSPPAVSYTKKLKTEGSESLPLKAAEMYRSFGARNFSTPKHVQPIATNITATSLKGPSELSSVRKAEPPPSLNSTDALRYKLLKKLKAKKKKLAKLNMLLGHEGGVSLRPDSTDLCSPSTVSSSTYDGSDDFLADLLSPATTASHLSPDSTEYLEMIASTQDGASHLASTQTSTHANEPSGENFLEEFLSQAAAQGPSDMETEALNALELFI